MILINNRILKSFLSLSRNITKEKGLIKKCKILFKNSSATNGKIIEITLLLSQKMKKYLLKISLNKFKEEYTPISYSGNFYISSTGFFHLK